MLERWLSEPLFYGGTNVDDAVMDLVAFSELAEGNERLSRELHEIEERISTALMDARLTVYVGG